MVLARPDCFNRCTRFCERKHLHGGGFCAIGLSLYPKIHFSAEEF
jgi:hypothetical protein